MRINMALRAIECFVLLGKVFFEVSFVCESNAARLCRGIVAEFWMSISKTSELLGMTGLTTSIGNRLQVTFPAMMFHVAARTFSFQLG